MISPRLSSVLGGALALVFSAALAMAGPASAQSGSVVLAAAAAPSAEPVFSPWRTPAQHAEVRAAAARALAEASAAQTPAPPSSLQPIARSSSGGRILIAQSPPPGGAGLQAAPSFEPQPGQSPFSLQPTPQPLSDIITRIEVVGSQRVDPGTVRSYMRIREGDRFDRSRLDESLKALFATGYFQDVDIRREGGALIVVVKENPVINRIAFEGNKRIDDDALLAELQLKPRLVYTIARAQADAQRIVEVYRRSGRFSVTVEPKLIELEQNRVDLVFEISEGELTEIHRIVFIGNKRFSDGALRSEINTEESRWYRFLSSDDIYDPDRLAFDQEQLRKFYLRNGYVDFRVISAIAELAPDKEGFIVTFTVEEGERYDVGSVTIESRLPDLPPESLQSLITISEGDHYNIEDVDETVDDMTNEVGKFGYAFVDVRPRVNRRQDEKLVDIVFEIGEGPKVYVERIDVVGNVRTLDEVIRREMRLSEGDAFNRAKVRESERRIRRLGFFESVKIENVPGVEPDRTRLIVEVSEKSTGELSVGAGVSSDSGVLAQASIRERNLLGRGQDLSLTFGISFESTELDLSFTEPYFLNRPLSAGFDIFAANRDLTDQSNFEQESIGAGVRFGYELSRHWRQTVGYQVSQDDIQADAGASRFILAQEGKAITSKVQQKLAYDNTDNFFDPTEGYRFSFANGLAGLGGDVAYFSTDVRSAVFFPVFDETVFTLSGRASAIFGLDDDVRLNDRYFLGGTTFRGFAVSGVGARDAATDDALGGNYLYLGTAELQFPLGLPKEIGLKGRVFTEAGAVFDVDDSGAGIDDSSSPRVSVGFGLTWGSPLGPLRIDFGYALIKEDFDDTETISFTFGTRF